jgi:endonuclease/exonuclease/phosphatase (EEP) superfamily protein YafD
MGWKCHYLKKSQKIALISTYQTVKYQSPGTTTIDFQQTGWLASNNRLIDPITGYQKDLILLLNNLKKEEIPFILAGDFNEHDQGSDTIKILLEYGLKRLEIDNVTESQKRGRHQIDHIFISTELE